MEKTLSARQVAAYEAGRNLRGLSLYDAWMRAPESVNAAAPIESACFEAGVVGHNLPSPVVGWRYGNIPASGYSRNHRDGISERGVSIMAIDGDESITDGTFELFNSDRPRVRISGFLLGFRGSDGEALVIGAKEVQ